MCVWAWATELLLPPSELSAAINGSELLVSWAKPHSNLRLRNQCFEYQLDLGDQVQNAYVYIDARRDDANVRNIRVSCAISMF